MPRTSPPKSARTALPAQRKADILGMVNEAGQVSVTDLADHFGVSADTVRRDLDELDRSGAVIRSHGGAVSTNLVPRSDTGLDVRTRLHSEGKEAIGRLAAELIPDGASVIINGGTTTLAATSHLVPGSALKIITNNLLLPSALRPGVAEEVYMVGGAVRMSAQATTGEVFTAFGSAKDPLADVAFDVALIGVGAISPLQGLSTGSIAEAELFRDMIRRSHRTIVLADASKIGRGTFARIAPLEAMDDLVTDTPPSAELTEALQRAGVRLHVAL